MELKHTNSKSEIDLERKLHHVQLFHLKNCTNWVKKNILNTLISKDFATITSKIRTFITFKFFIQMKWIKFFHIEKCLINNYKDTTYMTMLLFIQELISNINLSKQWPRWQGHVHVATVKVFSSFVLGNLHKYNPLK